MNKLQIGVYTFRMNAFFVLIIVITVLNVRFCFDLELKLDLLSLIAIARLTLFGVIRLRLPIRLDDISPSGVNRLALSLLKGGIFRLMDVKRLTVSAVIGFSSNAFYTATYSAAIKIFLDGLFAFLYTEKRCNCDGAVSTSYGNNVIKLSLNCIFATSIADIIISAITILRKEKNGGRNDDRARGKAYRKING